MPTYFNDKGYNRYNNLDGIEWRVIDAIVKSDSKYAKYIWKMLLLLEKKNRNLKASAASETFREIQVISFSSRYRAFE